MNTEEKFVSIIMVDLHIGEQSGSGQSCLKVVFNCHGSISNASLSERRLPCYRFDCLESAPICASRFGALSQLWQLDWKSGHANEAHAVPYAPQSGPKCDTAFFVAAGREGEWKHSGAPSGPDI